jgi:hypothetical protein
MKTIIAAAALAVSSNLAVADDFVTHDYEDIYKTQELTPGYGPGHDLSFAPVAPNTAPISLDQFNRGNPDYRSHAAQDGGPRASASSEICATSLDQFNFGNPESEFANRMPWERCI